MKRLVAILAGIILLTIVPAGCGLGPAKPSLTKEEAYALYHGAVEKLYASEQVSFDYMIRAGDFVSEGRPQPGTSVISFHLEWNASGEDAETKLISETIEDGESFGIVETIYKDGFMRTTYEGEAFESFTEPGTLEEWMTMQVITLRTFSEDAIDTYQADYKDDLTGLVFNLGKNGTVLTGEGEMRSTSEYDQLRFTAIIDAEGRLVESTYTSTYPVEGIRITREIKITNIRYSDVVIEFPDDFLNALTIPYTSEENPDATVFDFAIFPEEEFPRGIWTVNRLIDAFSIPEELYCNYMAQVGLAAIVVYYKDRNIIFEPRDPSEYSFYGNSQEDGMYPLSEADWELEFEIASITFNDGDFIKPLGITIGKSTKAQIIEVYGEEPAYQYAGRGAVTLSGGSVVEELNHIYYSYAFLDKNADHAMGQAGNSPGYIRYTLDDSDSVIKAELMWYTEQWTNASFQSLTFEVVSDWSFEDIGHGHRYDIVPGQDPDNVFGTYLFVGRDYYNHTIEDAYRAELDYYEEHEKDLYDRKTLKSESLTINGMQAFEYIYTVDLDDNVSLENYILYVERESYPYNTVYKFEFFVGYYRMDNFARIYERVKNSIQSEG